MNAKRKTYVEMVFVVILLGRLHVNAKTDIQ